MIYNNSEDINMECTISNIPLNKVYFLAGISFFIIVSAFLSLDLGQLFLMKNFVLLSISIGTVYFVWFLASLFYKEDAINQIALLRFYFSRRSRNLEVPYRFFEELKK